MGARDEIGCDAGWSLVDTHAHLDFSQFDNDRDAVIERARQVGVRWIINPGADLCSSRRAVQLANSREGIYAAVGVHPHEAKTVNPTTLDDLRRLASMPKVVAIGEIGLDYYRDLSPRSQQREAFRCQLALARSLDLPVIIHSREAHVDVLDILTEWVTTNKTARGVFHAFSGDHEAAQQVLALGFHVAIGGPVTFSNAHQSRKMVEQLPLDRLLIETDCPYLAPQPYRGKRNEPAFLTYVIDRLSDIRGEPAEKLAQSTTHNARALFGLTHTG